jgi:uncharacterized protein
MGEKVRIVLDTNTWISIALNKTLAEGFLPLIREKRIEACLSRALVTELARVITYPKIAAILEKHGTEPLVALSSILEPATVVRTGRRVRKIEADPADNRVLECAIYPKAKFIVSGDKHVLKLGEFKGVKTLTARKFLEMMRTA